jgi:hypothetical protein
LISSSHSRPRIINDADCTVDPPSVEDFAQPTDLRAQIFVSYVEICKLLSRLCQMLTRKGLRPSREKDCLGLELLAWINNLPPALRLADENGSSQPYSFEIAQLHIPFLSAITLVFSPRPLFSISPDNTAAVVAATLTFRIFEAFHLRDQICYLGPIFSWHLLVAAVTRLSCLRVPSLRAEAEAALDTTDIFLRELGSKWPSALNNLRNLQVLKKDANSGLSRSVSQGVAADRDSLLPAGSLLFKYFGSQATKYFDLAEKQLRTGYDNSTHSYNYIQDTSTLSQDLAHSEGATHTTQPSSNPSSGNGAGFPSIVESMTVGLITKNSGGDSWRHLDDLFAQDDWMMDGMEETYSTNCFSPTFNL